MSILKMQDNTFLNLNEIIRIFSSITMEVNSQKISGIAENRQIQLGIKNDSH